MIEVFGKTKMVVGVVVGAVIFLDLIDVIELRGPLFWAELWVLGFCLFDGAMGAYRDWQKGDLSVGRAWHWAIGAVVIWLGDAFLNIVVGVVYYEEAPRWGEWTLSERTQRLVDNPPNRRIAARALGLARLLNSTPDKGHIRMPEAMR